MIEMPVSLHKRDRFFEEMQKYHAGRTKEFNVPAMAAWFSMIQTFLAIETRVSIRVQAHGLTLPGMNVLGILCLQEPQGIPLHELSQYLTVSRANITGLIDNLVRKGYVKRVDHPTDRRVCLAQLTAKGKKWLDSFLPGHFKAIKQILSSLTEKEKSLLVQLLLKVRKTILTDMENG
jgi:DNA-binding MarR family transcriptional regulator